MNRSAAPPSVLGKGTPGVLSVEEARLVPNREIMLPGATGPDAKLAAFRTPEISIFADVTVPEATVRTMSGESEPRNLSQEGEHC